MPNRVMPAALPRPGRLSTFASVIVVSLGREVLSSLPALAKLLELFPLLPSGAVDQMILSDLSI